MDQYELLDVTRPYKSPLFNYRRSLKFVIHGYVENGTSGKMVKSHEINKHLNKFLNEFYSTTIDLL